MKDLLTVMKFTMRDMLKRKSFIISTIIIALIMVIGFNIPNIINSFKGDSSGNDKVLIIDSKNVFEGTLSTLNTMEMETDFTISNEEISKEEIKEKIESGDYDNILVIEKENENITIRYIVESTTMMSEVPDNCVNILNTIYSNLQISKLGLTAEQINSITPKFDFKLEQTSEKEVSGNVFTTMILSIVLFYAIYFCAYQVSSSITTEKTSKIMETLVTSTSPKTIVLGKTIGIGLVGLLQTCLLAVIAIICAKTCLSQEILDMVFSASKITPTFALVTILYFILGYFEFALIYALTGSTVSKPEDIQSANSPVAILTVIGFYLAYFTMMNPTSELNTVAAMLPISSPFSMPFRVMMGISSITEVLISLAILAVTIFIVGRVAIKIYSSAILNYGTKMSLKDIVKIYKSKD